MSLSVGQCDTRRSHELLLVVCFVLGFFYTDANTLFFGLSFQFSANQQKYEKKWTEKIYNLKNANTNTKVLSVKTHIFTTVSQAKKLFFASVSLSGFD